MKTILVICPTQRDYREIDNTLLNKQYNFIFQRWNKGAFDELVVSKDTDCTRWLEPEAMINFLVGLCIGENVDAVVSSDDYPGSVFASIVAERCGLFGPSPQSVLLCHHKYYSRCIQKDCISGATPKFWIVEKNENKISKQSYCFPFFIKPVKSSFSVYAQEIKSLEMLKDYMCKTSLSDIYLSYFNWAVNKYIFSEYDGYCFLGEEILEGFQVTVDGFVHNGIVKIIGIVDSVMFPGTISFERFEYPSRLPNLVQQVMKDIVACVIEKIGLDNTLFNVECIYNMQTGAIHIIEINPRMSSQFADLYEKVDGTNSYEIMIDIALGISPRVRYRNGKHSVAASCVLRTFEDKYVVSLPSKSNIDFVEKIFPGTRIEICAQKDKKLSDIKQDPYSYRYGLIHLGGRDWIELLKKYQSCLEFLEFLFEPTT